MALTVSQKLRIWKCRYTAGRELSLSGILDKRNNLHRQLAREKNLNSNLENQLYELQPLASAGLISAMIAHEINNILTPLSTYAQLARENPQDQQLNDKVIEKAIANSNKASKILESLLALVKGKPQAKMMCKLGELIDDIFSCLARDFGKDGITVRMKYDPEMEVYADEVSFRQVLMNLILNAREAMLERGGSLEIDAAHQNGSSCVTVKDTGCGIEPDKVDTIFEPFYSTKSTSDKHNAGTGLGLAFCKRVMEEHDGFISVKSQPGHGSMFTLILPGKET